MNTKIWPQAKEVAEEVNLLSNLKSIEKIILIGMLANTCIESTGRFGMELGYHAEGRFDRLIQKIKNKPICLPTQKKSVSSLV
jgi:hypothetical protein